MPANHEAMVLGCQCVLLNNQSPCAFDKGCSENVPIREGKLRTADFQVLRFHIDRADGAKEDDGYEFEHS